MVEVKNPKSNYDITALSFSCEQDNYAIKWSYQKGNSFLVVISSGLENWELNKENIAEITDHWQEIVDETEYVFRNFKVFFIKEPIFASQDKRFLLRKKDIDSYVPARISIFTCNEEAENSLIYKNKGNDGVLYIPAYVWVSLKYKNIWFTRKKRCFMKVNSLTGYQDGMVFYQIDNQAPDIPLTSKCLGREMIVTLPRQSFLKVEITEKYKLLYEVKQK